MRNSLIVIFLASILSSCYDCGPQKELTLDLYLRFPDSIKLNKIYAKVDTGLLDLSNLNGININKSGFSPRLKLPLTLHADQTTYLFEFENRCDSITVFYKRKFEYDNRCGFVNDVYVIDPAPTVKSSFRGTEILTTEYVGRKLPRGFFGNYYYGGIYINVDL